MKQKFPVLILILALILTVTCMAAGTQIEVRSPETPIHAGEEFIVSVELTGNVGFSAVQFTLTYDHDRMECTEALAGALLEDAISAANPAAAGGAMVSAASMDEIPSDGTLGTFTFRARQDLETLRFGMERIVLVREDNSPVEYSIRGAEGTEASQSTPAKPDTPQTSQPEPDPGIAEESAPSGGSGASNQPAQPDTPETSGTSEESGAKEPAAPRFTDTAGNWAESYIEQAAERGLFGGYADGSFRPGNRLTRAEFMIVLWNLAKRPEPSNVPVPFRDVADRSETVQKAVAWAWQQGYINGTGPDTFYPGGALTRQAAMKVLFGYHGGVSGMEQIFYSVYDSYFRDSGVISAWARPAMYWGVYHEILNGTTSTTLTPGGTITRAQLAAIMVRYTDRYGGSDE